MYITQNIRASQFLGDETATMRTREDTLSSLFQQRERGEGERTVQGRGRGWTERGEGQNTGSAAYNAGRRSQSERNAITLTRNPITYSFA